MTLRKLLKWHYFSVQEISQAEKLSDGSYDRKNHWRTPTAGQNLQGNLQFPVTSGKRARDDVEDEFAVLEFTRVVVLFHNYTDFPIGSDEGELDLRYRVLINRDPKLQVTFDGVGDVTDDRDEIRMYNILSNREPVGLRERNLTLFEMYLRENPRMSF